MNIQNTDVSFQIVSTDIENNSIIVRPWSEHFINPISSYPTYNLNISNLDPTEDLNTQIARVCAPIVRSTLIKESSSYNVLIDYLNDSQNSVITVQASAFNPSQSTTSDSPSNTTSDSLSSLNFVV